MNANISVMYMKKWCPGAEFDAYPKRQFVTESININSLAYHLIWSTIKTLPATLPELSFKVQGSSAGVTGAVCQSDLDVCWGWGRIMGLGSCALELGCGIGGGGGR